MQPGNSHDRTTCTVRRATGTSIGCKGGGSCRTQVANTFVVLPGLIVVMINLSNLWLLSASLRWTYRMVPLSGDSRAKGAATDRRMMTMQEIGRTCILYGDTLPTLTSADGPNTCWCL